MIGNDIIDLELTRRQSNWQRKGFLDKILTVSEQELVYEAEYPELMVWSFWSRKEACYKIFNRETRLRVYNPSRFECSEMAIKDGFYYGNVIKDKTVYHSKTEITSSFIHTIAVKNPIDFTKIFPVDQSETIVRENGLPYIETGLKPVSISHHGKYARMISI